MNIIDALCPTCEKPIRWLSGTPRTCIRCHQEQEKPYAPEGTELCLISRDKRALISGPDSARVVTVLVKTGIKPKLALN